MNNVDRPDQLHGNQLINMVFLEKSMMFLKAITSLFDALDPTGSVRSKSTLGIDLVKVPLGEKSVCSPIRVGKLDPGPTFGMKATHIYFLD